MPESDRHEKGTLSLDGQVVTFIPGQTLMEAAAAAGVYIPHLCHHPALPPHGSCKLCTVKVEGAGFAAACTLKAEAGMQIANQTEELQSLRRHIIALLFVDGYHSCPSCERSGNCQLQAAAYELDLTDNPYLPSTPSRQLDASHPDVVLDRDRCILCGLCVRASEQQGKKVFALSGRGRDSYLSVLSPSGRLGDSALEADDPALSVCPVGALLRRGEGFTQPIGDRLYDHRPLSEVGNRHPHPQRPEEPEGGSS